MKRAVLVPDFTLPSPEVLPELWPGRSVTVDGIATFVRETPPTAVSTEPALYVHGLGGSGSNWTDMSGLLAHRLDGHAIDLPGFGYSEPATSYTVAALADRVIRWIEHEDRGPVHLFGNSLGGVVTVKVAGTRPDLIRTLTLISPAMPFLDPRRSLQGPVVPLVFLPRAARIAHKRMTSMDPSELATMVVEACYADPTRFPAKRRAEAVEEARRRHTVPWFGDAYIRSLRGLVSSFVRAYLPGEGSLWRVASRITAPTLVIAGRQDKLVDIRVAPQVARVIPDSRLLMLDGVGHVAQMEVPRAVARSFLGMLDDLVGADVVS